LLDQCQINKGLDTARKIISLIFNAGSINADLASGPSLNQFIKAATKFIPVDVADKNQYAINTKQNNVIVSMAKVIIR